ncbi:MAG TPA: hypothetical protein VK989_08945 [Polyangia bacterium]|nr:hypothetical protein [Polyangia bacterium]
MSDPTRLVDDAGPNASALERELLRAGRPALAARERDEVWLGLAAQLAAPVAPSGQGAPAKAVAKIAAGAKAAAVVKGAIVVAALGGGAVVGYRTSTRGDHAPAPLVAPAPSVVSPPPAPPLEPPAPPSPVIAPREQRPRPTTLVADTSAHRPAASRLAAEGRVVLDARQALRDGQPDEALRGLEAARAEFGEGALAQEREALTIEALARAGRRDEARARAVAFLHAHPESPHAAAVRSFAAP